VLAIVVGSNLAEGHKIHSTTSFGGEVKPSVAISHQVYPDLLLDVTAALIS
jgi:hypothetical protein